MRRALVPALLLVTLVPAARAVPAGDAAALLRLCLPAAGAVSQRSRVEVEVTRKDAKPQTHRFTRLETADHLFITPADGGAYGLLQRRRPPQLWFYDAAQRRLEPITANVEAPAWLLSETLLDAEALAGYALAVGSESSMAGQRHFTITATTTAADPLPRRSLSFKIDGGGRCDLLRAAYFDADRRLRKKIFVQWQTVAGTKLPKALHIEDITSLEAVRYHVEDVQPVEDIGDDELPVMPPPRRSEVDGGK